MRTFVNTLRNTYFSKRRFKVMTVKICSSADTSSQEMGRSGIEPLRQEPSSALIAVIFKLTDDSVEYLDCQFSDVRTADRFLQGRFNACKESVIQIIRFKQFVSQDGYRILDFIIAVCHNNHLLSRKERGRQKKRLVKTCRPHVTGEDLHLT